jgi:mortality factor 4-like protein 1
MHVENENEEGNGYDSTVYGSPPPYLPDQRVLCKDENNDKHFYEAVVNKMKYVSQNEWGFYVHYQGWNSRWDRWVSTDELMADTPENRKAHLKPKEQKKRKTTTESSGSSRKRKSSNAPSKTSYYQEYCDLPFTLQTILVDEYGYITRKGFDSPHNYDCELAPRPARSVHVLPATVTVKQVLQHFQRKRGGSNEEKLKQQQVRKCCEGLALLFDDALPVCLLFPEERPQYESIQQDDAFKNKSSSEIYGCEFLLRLMVRLPTLLQAEPKSEMDSMGPLLADLIILLQKNRQACFKGTYREPKYTELLDWEKQLADNDRSADSSSKSPMMEK